MNKESKIFTAIMLVFMTILILTIGIAIGKYIYSDLPIGNFLWIVIFGFLATTILFVGVVEFIVQVVINEERSKRL